MFNNKFPIYILLIILFSCCINCIKSKLIINNYFYKKDDILENPIYLDMSEEYLYLNSKNLKKNNIVFVGDSLTRRFQINEFGENINVVNRGIFFDTTYGLMNRIDKNINNLDIDKLFIMIGINDIQYREDDEIIFNIKKIIEMSKAKNIIIQSLLPVGENKKKYKSRILSINNKLMELSVKKGCIYLDLYSFFIEDNNNINQSYTRDGIHLNYYGYKRWFDLVQPIMQQ